MQVEEGVLSERVESSADSLVSTNVPAEMNNEQTWPTEEEMQGADIVDTGRQLPEATAGTTPKSIKRVPRGTSAYQAAWIVDEEGSDDDDKADKSEDELSVGAMEEDDGENTPGEPEEMEGGEEME